MKAQNGTHSDQRKAKIIQQAKHLYLTLGVDNTSIAQIAKNVGISKSLFFYYFSSKDAVTNAVLDEICQEHINYLHNLISQHPLDFYRQLLAFADTYYAIRLTPKQYNNDLLFTDSEFMTAFHRKYLSLTKNVLENMMHLAEDQHLLTITFPPNYLIMVLEGIYGLYCLKGIKQAEVFALLQQALHLPNDCLKPYEPSFLLLFKG